ncbi:Indolepyruvate ferredoxin oxidoreductase, alpha and beta subunit [Roseibacterium elongatum DSM 19469]|uniref:Indolepyruvate ferredoxin oxidoreductase, alpha and beta subunit n=1 Tax=Roseicyclus elongatus DSM 19469 TaxID=1294273 RepID=W8RVD5_9RHOB|nr:indolepyruvate ferredoxin oxidoreductase family protein [Roseibacterium elongatum]AHM05248.1 Indolepyruvate ferredoxin oxidoreductase, alpha and beta subunit [Roseibacterium elongatum DSM 19469]
MGLQQVSLSDRFDLTKSPVLLNGTQALVRLMLAQKARDMAAGLNTAGLVTGYRGSPLGAVDLQMARAGKQLSASDIVFQPGLNEDLAATALWGSQTAELRGEGKFDGVFGLWYGKGPGVDRSGDVMRHVNMAGTSPHGGVVMAMGDDHTGESSTTCHQSDWALVDAHMPVLSPAGVQEILDFGHYGFALSRFAGVWVGLKTMKDTVEATAVVDGRPDRMSFVLPPFDMPEGGLNIRLGDHWVPQEERLVAHKRYAAEAFARANGIDKRVWGKPGAKIGLVAAGKNWLDLMSALSALNIDAAEAERLGITTYKVGQTWPMDMTSLRDWAEGLDLIVVVEEKRKLIEVQVKEAIFDDRRGRRVYGYRKGGGGEILFPTHFALDPADIALKLGRILIEEGRETDRIRAGMAKVDEAKRASNTPDLAARVPWFCSGCPHNTSTRVPDGARAGAGIGCHFMAKWMDRETEAYTHMGGEGVNWVGEAPFSTRPHMFQNLGEGTYNHSGILAIRAALAAGTNITYKILFNDAVAMTGGQHNEGDLDPARIAAEVQAMGVQHIALVYDPKEEIDWSRYPKGLERFERDNLMAVQEKYQKIPGVSVIIYVQTCAAEKRRRRKRGTFPDIDRRVFINTDVCEGCGDCGVQSNCVSIVPVETELGRKRAIDQSSCNKDFSCLKGFCPSFVTVEGGKIRKQATAQVDLSGLPEPTLPTIDGTHNVLVTGVGGTGVVTIGAVMAQAAQIDGKGAGMIEMAGLAQKGGAVWIHLRLANDPADISAIRVGVGEAHAVIGGDLVVTGGAKTLSAMRTGQTGAAVNSHEIITGDFTRDTEFRIPGSDLQTALQARLKDRLALFDATDLAKALLGDSIYSNMMTFGAAWQMGLIPLSHAAIRAAIELNGASIETNLQAFEMGRWAVENPDAAERLTRAEVVALPKTLDEKIEFRVAHLTAYQGPRLARRYRKMVDGITEPRLKEAVAKGYHKLLTYKDEYEVARLHLDTVAKARAEFEGDFTLKYHLAPPLLPGKDANGRPKKRAFGPWIAKAYPLLARLKPLRGTPLDVFGYSAERRMERGLIKQYERDMTTLLPEARAETMDLLVALAELPLQIKGFGPVKEANAEKAARQREDLLAMIRSGGAPVAEAAE